MNKHFLLAVTTISSVMLASSGATAQTTVDAKAAPMAVAPDNTKSNEHEPSGMNRTADDQKNNATDEDLTRRIRASVMADKTLSTYAHNAKIVSVDGTVTLNGVVRTNAEKANIAEKAVTVAGKDHVINLIKVQAAN